MYDGFSVRLDKLIKQLGGPGKACTAAGVSYPTLDRWKKGTSDPQVSNLIALTKATNVSLDWLVFGTDKEDSLIINQNLKNDDDYDYVPFYRVKTSSGHGSYTDEQRQPAHHLAFRKHWLTARGLHLKNLVGLVTSGDSMEPTIHDGAAIIANTANNQALDGHIYVIRIGDRVWVKRTQWLLDGGLRLISDNKTYENMDITSQKLENTDIEIIGQVIHLSYDLVK
ncbi:MAG: XRE family transcriptional regulator [Ostreibacterium sp.]